MQPIIVSVGPLQTASANAIVTSVTPTNGQSLTLTTSPYKTDTPRRVLVTYGAEGSARTLVLTGTDRYGTTQSETITVPTSGSTVASVLDYASITSIVSKSAFTNAITVGTNTVASSQWARMDGFAFPPINTTAVVTGTVNYTLEFTLDDTDSPYGAVAPSAMTWQAGPISGATVTASAILSATPTFVRFTLNSGSGSLVGTVLQTGDATY